jgi:plasmid maintenance system killer protein
VIQTFGDPDTRRLFDRRFVKRLDHLADTALRRLVALDAAKSLSDLRIPAEQSSRRAHRRSQGPV